MFRVVASIFRLKLILLAALALAAVACQAATAPSDEPLQWTDGLGRQVPRFCSRLARDPKS